jgi:phosphonopyruvate decarboxylase
VIAGCDVAASLRRHGFDFFTGVPCSLVEDVIAALERGAGAPYVAAVKEDAAVGLAAGAWLGGRRPAVLMQNSGLGTSLNALASLSLMYGLPCLLVVTWRGHGGKDAPEHILMGEISPRLLDLLGIAYRVPAAGSLDADLAWAAAEMDRRMQPVALLVPPGVVATGHGAGEPVRADAAPPRARRPLAGPAALPAPAMSRRAALGVALKALGAEPVVHANGYICRESFSLADRPQSFYMLGSMGLASTIALGLALARPDRRAVVFDGDGNLLMNLGALAQIGGLGPPNLVHLVFDNEVYGSTGNQASPSQRVRLDALAWAAGYASACAVTDGAALDAALREALGAPGPHFVLVKVTTEEADVPRLPYTPAALRDRFRAAVLEP